MTFRSEIAHQTAHIKESVDIASVIGDYIRLRKAGREFVGLCPFHTEKTASFHVSPTRRSYRCFGCDAKGDVFDFIARIERTDFTEARKLLADRAGIPVTSGKLDEPQRRAWRRQGKQDEANAERRDALIAFLRTRRNAYFRAHHQTRQRIVKHGADYAGCDFLMDVCEASETRYRTLDSEIKRLEGLSLAEFRKALDGSALDLDFIARAWKQDRTDAEESCTVLVALLTAAQIRDGDFPVQERAA